MRIKLIAFDIGGVLSLTSSSAKISKEHHSLGVHWYLAKKLKIDLGTWIDAIESAYPDSVEGKLSKKKALSIISRNLNIKPDKLEKVFLKSYRKYFRRNKWLYKVALKLKKKGYKIAILSDQWPVSREVLVKKEDRRNFDFVIISCDVGARKPQPKIYGILLRKAKMKAGEVVFIDNREWNLKPARKLGMKTILFENDKQVLRDLKELGVTI
jgi:putative hydrolase of the HAD superfamily